MTPQEVEEQLLTWIKSFVEQPHPLMNGWPVCPYARQARISNNIVIKPGTDPLTDGLSLLDYQWTKEVIVFWYQPNTWDADEFIARVGQLNQQLLPKDIVALEDHPDAEEIVSGIRMNFGVCPLVILQKNSSLNQAADQLKSKGYYDTWSQEDIDKIVTWRYNK